MSARIRKVVAGTISWHHWLTGSNGREDGLDHVGLHPGYRLADLCSWQRWVEQADGAVAQVKLDLRALHTAEETGGG